MEPLFASSITLHPYDFFSGRLINKMYYKDVCLNCINIKSNYLEALIRSTVFFILTFIVRLSVCATFRFSIAGHFDLFVVVIVLQRFDALDTSYFSSLKNQTLNVNQVIT